MENQQYYNLFHNLNLSQYFVFFKNLIKLTKVYFSFKYYNHNIFWVNYNPIINSKNIELINYDYKYLKILRSINKVSKFYSKDKFEYLNILQKNKYLLRDKFNILIANTKTKKKIKKLLKRKSLVQDQHNDFLEIYNDKLFRMIVLFYKTVVYEKNYVIVNKKKNKKKEISIIKGLIKLLSLNKILIFSKSLVQNLSKKLFSPKKVFLTIGSFSFDNLILRSFWEINLNFTVSFFKGIYLDDFDNRQFIFYDRFMYLNIW